MTTPTAPTIEEMVNHLDIACLRDSGCWICNAIRSALLSHAEVVKERDRLLLERDDARWQVKNLVGYIDELRDDRKKAEAEVVTLKQEISGNDSAHRLLLAEVERLKKGNEMVNQLLGEMTGKRDALKARLAEVQPLVEAAMAVPPDSQDMPVELKRVCKEDIALLKEALALRASRQQKLGRDSLL